MRFEMFNKKIKKLRGVWESDKSHRIKAKEYTKKGTQQRPTIKKRGKLFILKRNHTERRVTQGDQTSTRSWFGERKRKGKR